MNNQKKNGSGGAFLIIGLVLIVAVIGGLAVSNCGSPSPGTKPPAGNSASKPSSSGSNSSLATGPQGAVPPNMLGSPTAFVTVEEFADYQCPMCATMHPMMKEISSIYNNRIKFIFRSFPLTQIHDKAYDAAVAAEAASLQGKFWDMQNQLFTNQKTWTTSSDHRALFLEYAKNIGLDEKKFQEDIAGMPAKTRVDADLARARAANLTGTPSIFVNGMNVPPDQWNVNSLRQIIDAELAKQASQNSAAPAANTAANTSNAK